MIFLKLYLHLLDLINRRTVTSVNFTLQSVISYKEQKTVFKDCGGKILLIKMLNKFKNEKGNS